MTDKWIRDTGLVLALFFLILGMTGKGFYLFFLSGIFLLTLILAPNTLRPVAFVWKKIADLLAMVMNSVFSQPSFLWW